MERERDVVYVRFVANDTYVAVLLLVELWSSVYTIYASDSDSAGCGTGALYPTSLSLPRWRRGVVVSVVRRTNEVTLRRARLVLGWVTVFGRVYRHGM